MKNNWQLLILILCIGIYITYFTLASFLRHDNFYSGRFDLGNMDQTVWNTINGRIFQTSDSSGKIVSRLSAHADFLLILLSPFYLIWSHPKMLLLIQSVTLSFGAFFVYFIAKNIVKNKNLSLLFGIAFLLNPAVQFTNLYDFHTVALATITLLASFYFLMKNKYIWLTVFLILSGLAKEQIWLICSLFGIYMFLFRKNNISKKLGIVIFSLSLLIFYYLIWHAIPNTAGKQHFALAYYSDYGESPTEIVKNFFLSPQKTFATVFAGDRLNYLQQLFLPLGLLPLLSPIYLIFALPELFITLLSSKPQLHEIYYQYTAAITPFIFISAIYGTKNLMRIFPKISQVYYFPYLIIAVLLSSYFFGPMPFSKNPKIDMFTKAQKNKEIITNYLSRIPQDYIVAATNNLGAHLSQRLKIATIPYGMGEPDAILFLLKNREKIDENLKNNKNYVEAVKYDNFIVFKKRGMI